MKYAERMRQFRDLHGSPIWTGYDAPPAPSSGKARIVKVYRAAKNKAETQEATPQVHPEDRSVEKA